ncbi:putative ATPase (plasmid) [Phaeobacter inhibens]|uniref:ATPase n=2 Tax=Phaeobacter inhibens TaxID=221822 RepID=A0ABM6RKH5_9RHOB|nr:putative ATPase [Phaeobacter inhibens]AUQ97017.1 putative ATPase [Phaeobacter inhibens]AUR22217.1 putative ATPase [Phaeobacter inhibens]
MWDRFDELGPKEKGDRFEDLCFDLLSEMGFTVDRQSFSGRGGADGGQDLIIQTTDRNTGRLSPVCIVECKFRSRSTISGTDLWSPLLAVLELNVPSLLIITSSELASTFKSRIRSISQNSRWGISFRKLERKHLEALICKHPRILEKYFPDFPQDASPEVGIEPIIADIKAATSIERDGKRGVEITLHNTSPVSRDVKIDVQGVVNSVHLGEFQEQTVSVKATGELGGEAIQIEDETAHTKVADVLTKPPVVPISHIFVDPFDYVAKIMSALQQGETVLVSGRAGTGKSRIMAEIATQFTQTCILDLSHSSYDTGLVELLLERVFGLPILEVRSLPHSFIQKFISQNTSLTAPSIDALSAYIRQASIEDRGFAEVTARLCTEWFADWLVAIDNIHRLTLFDLEFLKALARDKKDMNLLLATRTERADMREVGTLDFLEQYQGDKWRRFVIDAASTTRLLRAYTDTAAINAKTRSFLRPWTNVDSVQKFILALKKLKAAGVLAQNLDGRFTIHSLQGAHPDQQKDILEEIVALVANRLETDKADDVLAAAAIFGFQFPAEYIDEQFGDEGFEVLDRLEELEIVSSFDEIDGTQWLRFDHETTAELIRQNTRPLLARRLHARVLDHLLDETRYVHGRDDARIALHLEAVGKHLQAATRLHSHAGYWAARGRYDDCLASLDEAKCLLDRVVDPLEDARLNLEVTVLHDFLQYASSGAQTAERRWQVLGAFKLALRLSGQEATGRMAGRFWFFKAQLERDRAPDEAERSIAASLDLLNSEDHARERAESHAWMSNFLKRRGAGRFHEATQHVRQALKLVRSDTDMALRSRCLLHAGALFLEQGRPAKTPWWWARAVDVLSGTRDIGALAYAMSDYAYIRALTSPDGPDTRTILLECLTLAQQFDLHRIGARAAINAANWRYFHDFDEEACLKLVEDAQSRIDLIEDCYQQALLDFSCLNFQRLHNRFDLDRRQDRLFGFLNAWFANGSKTIDGDQRVRNMLAFLSRSDDARARHILSVAGWAGVETKKESPYVMENGHAYATYY